MRSKAAEKQLARASLNLVAHVVKDKGDSFFSLLQVHACRLRNNYKHGVLAKSKISDLLNYFPSRQQSIQGGHESLVVLMPVLESCFGKIGN